MVKNSVYDFFATAPKGSEPLLVRELHKLGAVDVRTRRGGVSFRGDIANGYRACLWLRTASRVLLPLAKFPAADPGALYQGVQTIAWEDHLSPDGSLAVDFIATASHITHTQYGAQRVKDAVVDYFRERYGRRPSVDRLRPNLRINVYLHRDLATLSLDLSGDSLHRRGYRQATVAAPLKENLAAVLLFKLDWPVIAAAGGGFVDPMCGSGTLPIEAALIAADIAPGLARDHWGFLGWLKHDPALWETLLVEARQRREKGIQTAPSIAGYDHDPQAVRAALSNAERAGVKGLLRLECRALEQAEPPHGKTAGLLLSNPPYGERLGEIKQLESLYARLGEVLKERFHGWRAGVFTANPDLGRRLDLRAQRIDAFYNGPLECKLLQFSLEQPRYAKLAAPPIVSHSADDSEGADMFANRLRKNLRTLGRWAKREGISCYRLYDADIPEYAVAVDIYEQWVHVQEYQAPRSIDPQRAQVRLRQVLAAIPEALGMPAENVFFKVRSPQKGANQYQKQADSGRFFEVREGPRRFLVNLSDYLDTGLFLDHRITRRMLGELARGRRFLNLFGYTGAASVYAALGGAVSTTTVDLSQTYLAWAQRNLALNGAGGRQHDLIRSDCLEWLDQDCKHYDLIFLDPPTFSNSKRMAASFDVQRDHPMLIHKAMQRLDKGGVLFFSTNYRRFKLDQEALAGLVVEDISRLTLPQDFQRNPRIHWCCKITRPDRG